MKLRLLFSLFVCAAVSSCHYDPGSGEAQETGVIAPLNANNAWYYDRTDYAADGSSKLSIDSITIPNDIKENLSTGIIWYPWTDRSGMLRAANISTDPNFPGMWRVGTDLLTRSAW